MRSACRSDFGDLHFEKRIFRLGVRGTDEFPHPGHHVGVVGRHVVLFQQVVPHVVEFELRISLLDLAQQPFPVAPAYGDPSLAAGEFPVEVVVFLLAALLAADRGPQRDAVGRGSELIPCHPMNKK